jgi:hypothetical protein
MTRDEMKTEALNESTRGSLERITFSDEDDGEKSLLTLIEEHRPQPSQSVQATASEVSSNSTADPLEVNEDDEGHRLDHLMMRLGGNGF